MFGDTGNLLRMPVTDRTVLSMTPEAATAIIGIRAEEPDAADLALAVGITGAQPRVHLRADLHPDRRRHPR